MPMLARSARSLPRPDALPGGVQYEIKTDGYRLLVFTGPAGTVLQSRSGSLALTKAFPELVDAAAALSTEDAVLDGELVVQDAVGALDFVALQRRARHTGARARGLAGQLPAHVVLFDLLQLRGEELLKAPLCERRRRLEDLVDRRQLAAPWSLCTATDDPAVAARWLEPGWGAVGVEGCVAKARNGRYRPGERDWIKIRAYESADAVIAGTTGSLHQPATVLLGRWDSGGRLRLVARTVPLTAQLRTELGALLQPAGENHPWRRVRFSAGWGRGELSFTCVRPCLVAEFEADTATDAGRWRHPVRLTRLRPDRNPESLPAFGED